MRTFGFAKKSEISKYHTTIADGEQITMSLEEETRNVKGSGLRDDSTHEAESLQERITRLSSAIAVIRVGGATEIEVTEKKHRVEDALEAVKSAQEEGVVPGGGTALLKAANNIELEPINQDNFEVPRLYLKLALHQSRKF